MSLPFVPSVEALVPPPDPVRSCEMLGALPYRLFLDSASRDPSLARYSFLTADPVAVIRSRGSRTEWVEPLSGREHPVAGDPLSVIRGFLAPFASPGDPDLPPFQGGAAGFLTYDWGLELERMRAPLHDDLGLDDVVMGIYDWVVAWDHATSRAWLISTGIPEQQPAERKRRAQTRAAEVLDLLNASTPPASSTLGTLVERSRSKDTPLKSHLINGWWDPRIAVRSLFTRDGYETAVQRVRDYICAGDIFQANLSQRFEAPLTETPWALYQRVRTVSPTPFAAFLDFPEAVVLSASPERFLRVDPAGVVETRPIKGTRPRGLGPEHDAALGQALVESPKDRAENLMIVDLMRNDLSRVCAPGTVRVSELFALEQYATVHHLVSTIVGQLAPGADALDLLKAAFPGGSITGAPKVRAMEIIAELERTRRGVYCGSIAYWSVTGDLDSSVAIRTAVARNGRVYFSAGGGVVADSDPAEEYQETLDKARGFIAALAVPE
ncbi:MAG: aminodeoxychorismate synthase component I [Acidobacteria bacterium]|nr:aminodeoxychorismate synthase component I [Acidobacteriota bacterium]